MKVGHTAGRAAESGRDQALRTPPTQNVTDFRHCDLLLSLGPVMTGLLQFGAWGGLGRTPPIYSFPPPHSTRCFSHSGDGRISDQKKNLTQPTDFGAIGKGPHGKAICSRGLQICKPEANEVCRSCTAPERLVGPPIAWHWPRRAANTRLLRKYALDAGKVPGVGSKCTWGSCAGIFFSCYPMWRLKL
jgi:hypothetical protein